MSLPRWILLALALSFSACAPPMGACEQDSDCADDDCCIWPEDGGENPVEQCEPACEAWQQCSAGACAARFSSVVLTQPNPGARVRPGATLQVSAELQPSSAGGPEALELSVRAPGGQETSVALARTGSGYAGQVQLGTATGAYVLVARYVEAELSSASVSVEVDATGPTFEVTVAQAPTRPQNIPTTTYGDSTPGFETAHRYDEVFNVYVHSADPDVDGESVTLTGQIGAGAAQSLSLSPADGQCGSGAAFCARAEVQPWRLGMKAVHGEVTFQASGRDGAGNEGDERTRSAKVTRWKWKYSLATTGDPFPTVRAAPAIARDGTLIAGTLSGQSGRLVAINPDGTNRWDIAHGAINTSPAIGRNPDGSERVYFAAFNGTHVSMKAVKTTLGEPVGEPCVLTSLAIEASPAVLELPSPGEADTEGTVFLVGGGSTINGVTGRLTGYRPTQEDPSDRCVTEHGVGVGHVHSNIVSDGSTVFISNTAGQIRSFTYGSVKWAEAASSPLRTEAETHGLALSATHLVAGGNFGIRGLLSIEKAGGAAHVWNANSETWGPAIDSSGQVLLGSNLGKLHRVAIGGTEIGSPEETFDRVVSTPLLGGGGLIYTLNEAGLLQVRRSGVPGVVWSLSELGTSSASPKLDCSRDDTTRARRPGTPGVLYLTGNAGLVHALIVDSEWVDTSAHWPSFQRAPRNTGNRSIPWTEFGCN
jgi:hypothetical protein